MKKKVVASVAIVIVVALIVVVGTLPRERLARLTPEVEAAVGAAARVPRDASAFSSSFKLGERATALWRSNAVQNILRLPLVQQGLGALEMNPAYRQVQVQLSRNPLLVEGLPVLKDFASTELFVCTGPRLPRLFRAYGRVLSVWRGEIFRLVFAGPRPRTAHPRLGEVVRAVVANGEELRVPGILIGGKLSQPQAGAKFLEEWAPRVPPTPLGSVEKRQIRGADFYVLELSGEELPPDLVNDVTRGLKSEEVSEGLTQDFIRWLRSQRLVIAAGVLDGYLMLSVGSDTSLLEAWGRGASLAQTGAFGAVRASGRSSYDGINYASKDLMASLIPTARGVEETLMAIVDAIPDTADNEEIKSRARGDIKRFVQDITFPEPGASVGFSFINKGYESYSFDDSRPLGCDYSEPLAILAHRGRSPLICIASHSASSPDSYDKVVKWLKVGFSYVEDHAIPKLEPRDREQYQKLTGVVFPFLKLVDATTREKLVPAIDGTQSLFVLDGGGVVSRLPGGRPLPKPVPVPRLGMAVLLNDEAKFRQAMSDYVGEARGLLATLRVAYPGKVPPEVKLPWPQKEKLAGGTLYYYRLPWDLGRDVFPCALLKGRLLVVSTSARLAEEMAAEQAMPKCPVVALDGPAGSASIVDLAGGWGYLGSLSDALFPLIAGTPRERQERLMAMNVKMHIDEVLRSLGALRGYTSVSSLENGTVVKHSWFHIEDVAPAAPRRGMPMGRGGPR